MGPRRIAIFDCHSIPMVAQIGPLVVISTIGGFILLLSATLLIVVLVRSHFGERTLITPLRYALAVNPPQQVPVALNGFGMWNAIVLVLMVAAYGYPIGQFFFLGCPFRSGNRGNQLALWQRLGHVDGAGPGTFQTA